MQKFLDWLEASNPFSEDDGKLRSLASGLVVSETDQVTCDSAEEVGTAIHERWNDVSFYDVCLKKCDKVTTLASLHAAASSQKVKGPAEYQ